MDRSSPTTTSAVNEKRRPPFTTLATRAYGDSRSKPETAFPSAVGQRPHAPVVAVAATVEHARLDTRLLRALGDELARLLRLLHGLQLLELRLGPGHRRQGVATVVVDQLGQDAAV